MKNARWLCRILCQRRELERTATPSMWRGCSDTETLLATVEARGVEEALRATVGMFAFALWDPWTQHLSGRRNWQYPLWTVLMFQAWRKQWASGSHEGEAFTSAAARMDAFC